MNKHTNPNHEITRLLIRHDISSEDKSNQLLSLVYVELKKMAQKKMLPERAGHTLTPTSLVHEAYMRLVQKPDLRWQCRAHFFSAAAESMRRILIDSARSKASLKKGAYAPHTHQLDLYETHDGKDSSDLMDLDRALTELEKKDEVMSQVVKLRYFAGLTLEEIALSLDMSLRTISRIWSAARAWLIVHMNP